METWVNTKFNSYSISNKSRVKSHERFVPHPLGGLSYRKEKLLKPVIDKKGYLILCLHENGKQFNYKLHRLMAEAFIPNPDNLPQINHKNGIKTDNRIENLEWCNEKHNMQHAVRTGLKQPTISNRKLSNDEIIQIRNSCDTRKEIANKYNVSISTIGLIKNNKIWKNNT